MSENNIICAKCNVPLEPKEVIFEYMNFHISHTLPACPVCGQVFISEELAMGKMREVELTLEEK